MALDIVSHHPLLWISVTNQRALSKDSPKEQQGQPGFSSLDGNVSDRLGGGAKVTDTFTRVVEHGVLMIRQVAFPNAPNRVLWQ